MLVAMKAPDAKYGTPTGSLRAVPFRVFIGYADQIALRRATTTIADAVRASGRRVEMVPLLWRFGQLSSPRWRDLALSAAMQAHAVVLACTSPRSEPELESWVNSLLSASRGLPITVVAVFGESDAWTITLEGCAALTPERPRRHPAEDAPRCTSSRQTATH